jgi:polyisoprenoid-binding protein YceI
MTAPDAARIDGALSFNGVTAPVSFEARFNGGYKGFPPYDPSARIGFSAKGALTRSVFNVAAGLAPPGSTMGVGDRVDFEIEAEFNGPPAAE